MAALQRVVNAFPNSAQAGTARDWNSILYRLYVRPPAQPAYVFANRTIAGSGGKLKDVTALTVGADGSVFVSSKAGVIVVDPMGTPVRSLGSGEARALALDQAGRVVLVQKAALQQEGAAGTAPTMLTLTVPSGGGQAKVLDEMSAVGVLSTPSARADRDQRGVPVDPAGKFVGPFAAFRAHRIAVGPGDLVALLDRDSNTISVYDRAGKPATKLGARGAGFELKDPSDLAYDSMGHLYVLDRSVVAVFAPDGKPVTRFSAPEKSAGSFKNGSSIALDGAGGCSYDERRADQVHQGRA
jgi:hypothetical protein